MYPGNSRILPKNDFYSDSSDVDMDLTSEKQVSYSKNLSSQEDKISLSNQSLISVEKNFNTFSNSSQSSLPVKRVFLDSSSGSDIELPSLDLLHPAVVKQLTDKKKTTARKRKASTMDVEINVSFCVSN